MMDDRHIHNSKSTIFVNEHRIKRTRRTFLIIGGICLGICMAYAITTISSCITEYRTEQNNTNGKINLAFMSVLFYGFGLLVAYRYCEIGLRIFGWLGIIWVIITGVTLTPIDIDLLPSSSVEKRGGTGDALDIDVFLAISSILCMIVYILTIIIIFITFKLAKLLDSNQQSTTVEI